MRAAHAKAVECLTLALPHLDPPGERVLIPFEGKHLAGVLRLPRGAKRPPIVLMTMGLDSTNHRLFIVSAKFGPPPASGRGRGPVLPGTFSLMVIEHDLAAR